MKVSLAGLFANIVHDMRAKDRRGVEYYETELMELHQHIEELIQGKRTLQKFAEHWMLLVRKQMTNIDQLIAELRDPFVRYCRTMQPQSGTRRQIRENDARRRKAESDIVRLVVLALGPPTEDELGGKDDTR